MHTPGLLSIICLHACWWVPVQVLTSSQAVPLCMLLVVAGCLPAMVQQIRNPTTRGLLLCMANCAFSFYMFGFQVCEGSFCFVWSICKAVTGLWQLQALVADAIACCVAACAPWQGGQRGCSACASTRSSTHCCLALLGWACAGA